VSAVAGGGERGGGRKRGGAEEGARRGRGKVRKK